MKDGRKEGRKECKMLWTREHKMTKINALNDAQDKWKESDNRASEKA